MSHSRGLQFWGIFLPVIYTQPFCRAALIPIKSSVRFSHISLSNYILYKFSASWDRRPKLTSLLGTREWTNIRSSPGWSIAVTAVINVSAGAGRVNSGHSFDTLLTLLQHPHNDVNISYQSSSCSSSPSYSYDLQHARLVHERAQSDR